MLTDEEAVMAISHRRREVAELLAEAERAFREKGGHLSGCLTRLADAMETHAHSETATGVLDDIVTQAPRLSSQVVSLIEDHDELPGVFRDLRERLDLLRDEAASAFERLAGHHRLADHLVYEAFSTDLGGDG